MILRSLTIPSSVVELDRGGDGVGDLKEEAPLLDDGEGRSMKMGCCTDDPGADWARLGGKKAGECGLQESFMSNMAAEHSDKTSSSSATFSLVRLFRDLINLKL